MTIEFDLTHIATTEFGVGHETANSQRFFVVPVDASVQQALREMTMATWEALEADTNGPVRYEPSEKHGGTEYLWVPTKDPLALSMCQLHEAPNLPLDATSLSNPEEIFCYFARFTDSAGKHLTAVHRAGGFKGVLKSRNRLVRMLDDTLKIINDAVFRLDADFDLLVDSTQLHILRPSGFEFVGKLQEAVLGAAPENILAIGRDLEFVNFDNIGMYAAEHPRAARYLASIRGQAEARNINRAALKKLCKRTGVEVTERNGLIVVSTGHVMGFLEVLDRRRYELELVEGRRERFKAGSRTKLNG